MTTTLCRAPERFAAPAAEATARLRIVLMRRAGRLVAAAPAPSGAQQWV
ncbi:hypothetical protein ACTPOK_27635 [Streptomyces inhibens]